MNYKKKNTIASMPINLLFLYKKELSGAVFINKIERERGTCKVQE